MSSTPITRGINHLGLAVLDLEKTAKFFVDALGWTQSARDPTYPRTAVSDGHVRLTLWQVVRDASLASIVGATLDCITSRWKCAARRT
jgi:catechol 2,3-dioxygenase-like lactoylglutathione lyase family enzyme